MLDKLLDPGSARSTESTRVRWVALAIAAAYGFIGALWIGFSDQFVAQLNLGTEALTRVQQYKGWAYVIVTAVLLYVLLRSSMRYLERSMQALAQSRDQLTSMNRLYRMVRAIKGTMLRGQEMGTLLEEACRVAVTEGGYRLAWVGTIDPDGDRLRAIAHSGVGEEIVRGLVVNMNALPEASPVTRALASGRPEFANDCGRDPILVLSTNEYGPGSTLGYSSVAALPLKQGNQTIGCLTVYARRALAFDRSESRLLMEVSEAINLALRSAEERRASIETDEVTLLPNRRTLHQQITAAITCAVRRQEQLALMVIDIDGFRRINDTLGRAVGDQVLRLVSRMLDGARRPGDQIFRLGDDEFAVLLAGLENQTLTDLRVDRIAGGFPQILAVGESTIPVSISMGVAVFPGDAVDSEELFSCAELALHNIDPGKQSQICYYEPSLNETARRQREFEHALRAARVDQDFHLAWQPIVDIETGETVAAEALVRWQHPLLGLVSPGVFIPIAEASGQIIALGHWVLVEAIRQGDLWSRGGMDLDVHVNVSLLQLQHPSFIDDLSALLQRRKSRQWRLVIEITESQLMADPIATASCCRKIRELGCGVELDDFGTGYSSLGYLTSLPLNGFKLDRSFITGAESVLETRILIEQVIQLGARLDLDVIAEGIEDEAHVELLRAMGCRLAQGYLFGRPGPPEAIVRPAVTG